ncbi:putative endoplasmic reticulum-Golgi intermediate compartment protein 3 [Tetrabaena socialis]|uniref:Putative endoplasmic reticulum-Golgi intermediate compartment protein 3 n=1 Tax=Tetrabaena socialis TaxID=47790 RepID=A0A2J8ABJ3_9CHLO|nr:putative endoplasmic reticulum-Golgi intermediate compartment protein 3 [Tetrabaena socialis]|eukprot:PNH09891.1 putative endoplasmic reticulum-Golgi intermediate compartment protein 3 [Tetrabaena socialis]
MGFKIATLSAYVKPEAHLMQQTIHGALVTLCGILLASVLFVHELGSFYKLHRVTKMSVDLARRHALTINIDLTFPRVPCAGRVTETHQYSVTEYAQPVQRGYAPALDVHYDLSPIVMTINERPPSLLHFLVRICAVVGGAFAVTRMVDRWVDWLVRLVSGSR